MKEDVYWIRIADQEPDEAISRKLAKALAARDFFSFVEPRDMVAFKTHFGEEGSQGYVRPLHFHMMSAMVKKRKGRPFLTETSTLYTGKRSNAVEHMELALSHGFGFSATGMPILMADGLLGDEEQEVEVPGRLSSRVKIAALIVKTQALGESENLPGVFQPPGEIEPAFDRQTGGKKKEMYRVPVMSARMPAAGDFHDRRNRRDRSASLYRLRRVPDRLPF